MKWSLNLRYHISDISYYYMINHVYSNHCAQKKALNLSHTLASFLTAKKCTTLCTEADIDSHFLSWWFPEISAETLQAICVPHFAGPQDESYWVKRFTRAMVGGFLGGVVSAVLMLVKQCHKPAICWWSLYHPAYDVFCFFGDGVFYCFTNSSHMPHYVINIPLSPIKTHMWSALIL